MPIYKEVPLKNTSPTKEDIEYLTEQTLALIRKKKISFKAQSELQMALDCLLESRTAYLNSHKIEPVQVTDSLKDLDRQRDHDFTDLRFSLRAQLRHRQANRQTAAIALFEITERYKTILSKPQAEQSAGMKEFFGIMDQKDNQAKLTLVGVMDYYNNLKQSQEKFDEAYLKRVEGRSQRQAAKKDEARRQLVKTYRTVYRYLLCLEHFGKSTAHQELLGIFNDVRLAFNEAHARKEGQAKKKAKKTEPVALLEEPLYDFD